MKKAAGINIIDPKRITAFQFSNILIPTRSSLESKEKGFIKTLITGITRFIKGGR
jgi:hypothetical protein